MFEVICWKLKLLLLLFNVHSTSSRLSFDSPTPTRGLIEVKQSLDLALTLTTN